MLKEGKKTRLIPFGKEHLPLMVRWHGDPENIDFFRNFNFPMSATEAESWYGGEVLAHFDKKFFVILAPGGPAPAVVSRGRKQGRDKPVPVGFKQGKDNPIGLIHLFDLNWQARKVELGIIIGEKDYRGSGYAFDSLVVIGDYIFNRLNLNKVYIKVNETNERLIRFCKKGGFEIEGVLKDEAFQDGRFYNLVYMALFQKVFQERYGDYFKDPSMSLARQLRGMKGYL